MRADPYAVAFERLERDFVSLRANYYEIHGDPMPYPLQCEVLEMQCERDVG